MLHRIGFFIAKVAKRSAALVAIAVIALGAPSGNAMIRGGKGNEKLTDPGWPAGAERVFNVTGRIAWWEGPPFGGGQWHSECQGDASKFNETLTAFAAIGTDKKRLIVCDGVGSSFWLDPNQTHQDPKIEVDWTFTVWQPDRWQFQKDLKHGMSALRQGQLDGPVPEICLYTGGAIRWDEVEVPKGIEVVDNRLEAHGYSLKDGRVLEGTVTDAKTGKPMVATVRMEHILANPKGGYEYKNAEQTKTDELGHWVFKNIGTEWSRIIVEADGYAPRLIEHIRYRDQPGWQVTDTSLAKQSMVQGQVRDDQGAPLADVEVSLSGLMLDTQGSYSIPEEAKVKSDAKGGFTLPSVDGGTGTIWIHKSGYVRPGLGQTVTAPTRDVVLTMSKSASLRVHVLFPKGRAPGEYIVHIKPEAGETVGSWGGSSLLDVENHVQFKDAPAGRYVISGRPNPGSDKEQTEEKVVELKPGADLEVDLVAK